MKSALGWAIIGMLVPALFSACGSGDEGPPPVSTRGWTWVSGSNTADQAGTYGLKGSAAPSNVPGGRYAAVSWLDSGGILWLFGGYGISAGSQGLLNDLWKYSGTNWTWVSGSNSAGQVGTYGTRGTPAQANVPGARELAVSWLDSTGSLWLFGGYGYDSAGYNGSLNDLWKYDPITLEWAWVSGSSANGQVGTYGTQGTAAASNIPGARFEAVSWLDSSGKLWLFGGWSYAPAGNGGGLNDLWKYDPATLEWTWVSGSNIADQAGTYGLKGTANSSNIPGARGGAVSWLDSTGKLWLFGGYGYDSAGLLGYLNDLWMYDGTTWTWISGSRSANQLGTYGTQGIPGPTNVPGVRELAVSWLDSQGKLLLFGGFGFDLVGNDASLNDLWKYDPATLEWTWVSGSSSARQLGIYGTKGAAAPSNVPGARYSPVSWLDSGGKLWLFGGRGYDSTGNNACLNDLWRFTR